jgi:hypothetical protein
MQPDQWRIIARDLDVPEEGSVVGQEERFHIDRRPCAL